MGNNRRRDPRRMDNSTPMTLNAETGEWSITTELAAGNYKFRANNKWDINLGGDLNHLTYGGDNITTEAGTYVITLKIRRRKQLSCHCSQTLNN